MPYAQKTITAVHEAQHTRGNELGRQAIRRDLSMQRIAQALGVSRQTVYNWFISNTEVMGPYRDRVETLIDLLTNAKFNEDVWKAVCIKFEVKN